MQFQLSVQPLLPLLQQCIDVCEFLDQPLHVWLTVACPPELQQVQVQADASRLKQVLLHLLGNAVKFSPPNSAVQVSLQLQQRQLRVLIADQGAGISEQFVPKLFSRFSQADSSDSRIHGGSGLGLAVSKSIISHMHGSIGYMPNKPQGSCFYIELPFDASIQPGQLP